MNTAESDFEIWKTEIEHLKRKVQREHSIDHQLNAFYGSSSIRLWQNISKDLYPHSVINLGFGGSSYYWCNIYFEEVFEGIQPQKVILYAGDNDLGKATPEDEILSNFTSLIHKIKAKSKEIRIAVISVKPSPDREYLRAKIEHLNQRFRRFIESENGDYIDIYAKMLNADESYRPELFTEDMLHMNDRGYEIWKQEIARYLDQ